MLEDSRQADAIEITPAMIEAGASVLWTTSVGSDPCDAAREVVEDVFRAMLEASTVFQ